jgi:DNA-binding CsgD family transcriptional regulator
MVDEEGVRLRALPGGECAGEGEEPPRLRSAKLSRKERRVLDELARGLGTDDIAEQMFVSPHTVRTHVKNAMRKLGAKTRAQAVAIALSEGAIEAEPPAQAAG